MKALFITFSLFYAAQSCCAQSPNANEWWRQKKTQRNYLIQQIAALEVYYNYLKKGYEIADKGLTLIGDIKEGAFQNDKAYIESLRVVSPAVRDSPRLSAILTFRNSILKNLRDLSSFCRASEFYTSQEAGYIESIYKNMSRQCAISMDELSMIASGETEMKDDERIKGLDDIYQVMQDRDAFARSFCSEGYLLARERAKEKQEIETSTKLNGL
jgi:hypothetical protein